jgi:hypothetical protein
MRMMVIIWEVDEWLSKRLKASAILMRGTLDPFFTTHTRLLISKIRVMKTHR